MILPIKTQRKNSLGNCLLRTDDPKCEEQEDKRTEVQPEEKPAENGQEDKWTCRRKNILNSILAGEISSYFPQGHIVGTHGSRDVSMGV